MKLPEITNKQQTIIKLIYKYRFLNRKQIQALMNHKDYKTINVWLKDLAEKQYLERIYSTHFAERTKPAIYYLGINGIRSLKITEEYPLTELRKRYREPSRSSGFIDTSILLADCCLKLVGHNTKTTSYASCVQAEYTSPDSDYHFLFDNELISPNLCIREEKDVPDKEGYVYVNHFLLEIFEPTLPRYRIKKRLTDYVKFLEDEEWEDENDPQPIILLVCPRLTDLIYAKRRTRGLLANIWDEDDRADMHIRFTTTDKLAQHGALGDIWEEA